MTIGRNTVAGELLRGVVERLERLAEQKRGLGEDEKAAMADAKAKGLVPAAIRFVIKKRRMKPSDRQEAEAMEDMYMHAMGLATDTPLFRHVGLMSVDVAAKEQVIEALRKFVPANGSITVEAGGRPVRLTRGADGMVTAAEVAPKPEREDRAAAPAAAPKMPVPDVDADGAEALGRAAFAADEPIIRNPFPFGDPRRARWDAGWRAASGSDGMDD